MDLRKIELINHYMLTKNHLGRTCQALQLENICYQRDALSSQNIGKSNPFYIDFRDYYAKD